MTDGWQPIDPRLPADPRTDDPKNQRRADAPKLVPRDAGTLIILDRAGGSPSVLVGKRGSRHAFMAERYVFPGGRTDPIDSRVALAAGAELRADDSERLLAATAGRFTARRAAATALSAIRETWEEAGILVGRAVEADPGLPGAWAGFGAHHVVPDLSRLRFIARAITPPGRVRRFDARFFACWRDEAVAKVLPEGGPTNELSDLNWLTLDAAIGSERLPGITRIILGHLAERLRDDPDLSGTRPVPMHSERRGAFTLVHV